MKKFLSIVATAVFICNTVQAAPMTLNVHDADLRATIMMIAKAGRLNLSLDNSVSGKISVALNNLEPEKILEIIARTNNLNITHEGRVYILTAAANNSLRESFVLPIKFGDAEFLRQAVIMSLDVPIAENNSNAENNSETEQKISENNSSRVLINSDVNALILYGTQAEYERAQDLLETLDIELKQVSVEAKIVAIDKNAGKNLGVEWMWSSVPQYPERDIEVDETSNGRVIITEEYTRQSNDNTGYGILQFGRGPAGVPFEWYYGAKLNALVTDGKAEILSRPNVTTIQGREAVINVGSSVPVPKVSTTNSTTTTSIEYRDAGIILRYTPRINSDGTITATIHTEVSTPQYVEDLKAYRFNKRTADTTVTLQDGEPMIIGGLISSEESRSFSKIPFLGDLPILGALFKNHRRSHSETELMIFLTARVIK